MCLLRSPVFFQPSSQLPESSTPAAHQHSLSAGPTRGEAQISSQQHSSTLSSPQTSTTPHAAAATHPWSLWSLRQTWSLRIPTIRLQTALNPPTAVPSHLTSGSFSCTSSPRTPDCHSSTTRGMALLGDISFYYQYSPFPCTSSLPWKLGIIPRNKKYFKTWRAYLVSSEGWSYKARDSGTESHGHPFRDFSASTGWAPGWNDAASAQSAAVKCRSFCWMKSQLPCWCALAPFQLQTSSLSCRGLQLGGCFLLAWLGLKNKARKKDEKECFLLLVAE